MFGQVRINGRFLTQVQTGVQRYARELVRALDRLLADDASNPHHIRPTLLVPPACREDLGLCSIETKAVGSGIGHSWEQIALPKAAGDALLLNLCNAGPLAVRNQVITLHDAGVFAVPRSYGWRFRLWYRFLLQYLAKRSRAVTTVSAFARQDICRYLNIPPEKVSIIPDGWEHITRCTADESILERYALRNRPYLLAVSSMNPRKNFDGLARALEHLGQTTFLTVIAGGTNPRVFGNVHPGLPKSVLSVGRVTDGQLRALYEHAQALIFPSLYEGFGVPLLEAMACDTPVIASDILPFREVCADAAHYFDPRDPRAIADAIGMIMRDEALRQVLRTQGRKRLDHFGWEKSAETYWKLISNLL